MKLRRILPVLACLVLAGTAALAAQAAPPENPELAAKAERFVDLLARGELETAAQDCNQGDEDGGAARHGERDYLVAMKDFAAWKKALADRKTSLPSPIRSSTTSLPRARARARRTNT